MTRQGDMMTDELKALAAGDYVDYFGDQTLRLDGDFDLDQLRAMVRFLEDRLEQPEDPASKDS